MTATVSFDRGPEAPLTDRAETTPELPRRRTPPSRPHRTREAGSLRWSWCPAAISVGVNAIFLIAWWAPEFGEFSGHDALLGQLWPLAAVELVSAGQPVVSAQAGHPGWLAALMLVSAVALPFLVRSRSRAVRSFLPAAAVYVGALAWLVTLVQALSSTTKNQPWSAMLLQTAWVLTAAVTVWRSRNVSAAALPDRRPALGWLVAVFALLYPLPIALGRAVFAPDVSSAARGLLAADPTQQFAVLLTGSTVLAYVAGVTVALVGWALYLLVPPYAKIRVPWARQRPVTADPMLVRIVVTVVCGAALLLVAFPTADAGRAQARQWLSGNPSTDHLACATWEQQRPGRPTATMVSSGEQCRTLTSYAGYTKSGSAELAPPLHPVKATLAGNHRKAGPSITTRVVAGQYGAVVVLASTAAIDLAPDELFGVSMDTAQTVWSFRCDDDGTMRLRFAGSDVVPGTTKAAQLAAGHVTEPGEEPAVVVQCTNQAVRLDPATGQPTK